jgi:hypothetical protein
MPVGNVIDLGQFLRTLFYQPYLEIIFKRDML